MKEFFFDTIKEVYKMLFHGRVRRKKFWMYILWYFIFFFLTFGVGSLINFFSSKFFWLGTILISIGYVVIAIAANPNISLQVRRLHDIGKSGWNLLLIPVPFLLCSFITVICRSFNLSTIIYLIGHLGSIAIMLYFGCKDSQPGNNQYGPNPKGIGSSNSIA